MQQNGSFQNITLGVGGKQVPENCLQVDVTFVNAVSLEHSHTSYKVGVFLKWKDFVGLLGR